MPKVLVVRGHQANPWELRAWEELDGYDVEYLTTERGHFDTSRIALPARRARALRDMLPAGRLGELATRVPGDRYLNPRAAFEGADIVHAQELGYWYAMQAARLKARLGYKLVLTVWETLPFGDTYRNARTRPYRRRTLAAADLFLAATERAAAALRLEGADPRRIKVSAPGIDVERFGVGRRPDGVVLSAGRLVWEKGHQDVIRAVAAMRMRVVDAPVPRLVIIGRGPEEARLRRYADELGIGDRVEIRPFVPYEEMPKVYASASCLVLASIPVVHWEEQFGMVLAEAMAAGLPIVAASSGAIPEVAGPQATYFAPGDWLGLARSLADVQPVQYEPRRVERFSAAAAARRLEEAYDGLLA